jgi:hypothetical protein
MSNSRTRKPRGSFPQVPLVSAKVRVKRGEANLSLAKYRSPRGRIDLTDARPIMIMTICERDDSSIFKKRGGNERKDVGTC